MKETHIENEQITDTWSNTNPGRKLNMGTRRSGKYNTTLLSPWRNSFGSYMNMVKHHTSHKYTWDYWKKRKKEKKTND